MGKGIRNRNFILSNLHITLANQPEGKQHTWTENVRIYCWTKIIVNILTNYVPHTFNNIYSKSNLFSPTF